MVTTPSMVDFLAARGFKNLVPWARVAVEKNIEAFLDLELPGSKVIIGNGPQLEQLKRKYSNVHFLGSKFGDELGRHFADADVFVFPSKTDTFGLVIIESMATGTPVAAYPVTGVLHAKKYSWENVTDIFFDHLTPEYEPVARKRWRRIRRMMIKCL